MRFSANSIMIWQKCGAEGWWNWTEIHRCTLCAGDFLLGEQRLVKSIPSVTQKNKSTKMCHSLNWERGRQKMSLSVKWGTEVQKRNTFVKVTILQRFCFAKWALTLFFCCCYWKLKFVEIGLAKNNTNLKEQNLNRTCLLVSELLTS